MRLALVLLPLVAACGKDDGEKKPPKPVTCEDMLAEGHTDCVQIGGGDAQALLDAANLLEDGGAIVLEEGTWELDNSVIIRNVSGVTLIGRGMQETILDFGPAENQVNGVDVVADDFRIEALTILDAPKDGLRIEDSDGITIRAVEATWTNQNDPENGAYGLYPVRVQHVLLEDSIGSNASDAGIYVGQCQHAVVRNNVAVGNVAGLEIENTQFADVYGNTVEDNTGGLLIFDLPGNPVIGRDIQIHDNVIRNNNRPNFAPGGVVRSIPAGTGTFAMASRRVEITGNTYANNDTVDIALISGLVIESDEMLWRTLTADLVGDTSGLDLPTDAEGIFNYRSYDLWVHGNTHDNSGTAPDMSDAQVRELGALIGILYGQDPVDTVLYDALGESSHDPANAAGNSNDNRICVEDGPGVSMASLNIEELASQVIPRMDTVYRPDPPFVPFDCEGVSPKAPEGVP